MLRILLILITVVALGACASSKKPAEQAISPKTQATVGQSAWNLLSSEARRQGGRSNGQATQPAAPHSVPKTWEQQFSRARILTPSRPLQCVPFARETSGISIHGDAWTWWSTAEGRFERHGRPAIGSVLVLQRSQRLRGGHVAVVTGVLDERTILVSHANWLNRGRIHENTPVRDVSLGNDWSAVRLWYTPGRTLGGRTYPAHGFIYPRRPAV